MVDGTHAWWQSPPLSRGMKYNEVNITLDLGQAFHIVYVWIQMANSPRPGTWILERSKDFGQTWEPWQYFATSPAECTRLYGIASLSPVTDDDSVICTSDYSAIQPMDNGEIMVSMLENRPGKHAFSMSPKLRDFTLATNVRIRLLRVKTLQGHLMDLNERSDPTVTRRYFYAVKELILAGRCVCNGHAPSCDVRENRKDTWICTCEHHTTGDNCERCEPGYEQKKWRKSSEGDDFECEPCNCHGHSLDCEYDEEVDRLGLSMDIHGNYEGGGRCKNCQDNTQGINCNECVPGYYRPYGKLWNETDVCQPCSCDPTKHTGNCADETGICECLPQFTGPNCDQCAQGYYHPPECRPCECNVNGTQGSICLPINGKCPCKTGYGGAFCEQCAAGYTNLTAGCVPCACDNEGSLHQDCDVNTTQCACKSNYGGLKCDECAKGYFNHPTCEFCDCDPGGTEDEVCDKGSGQCLCKPGFAGRRCDQCDERFYGYPNCRECSCDAAGSKATECDPVTGECPCYANFTGRTCDKCAAGYYRYPECLVCGCNQAGSKGLTCDNDGQCYCKENFQGKQCDRCKDKLYNFPICEECNCHPSGVIPEFAGCDKVAPGELCTCRANVQGRTCSQCKPTFWDLQPYHVGGCIDCACNMTGTISLLNSCDQQSGQCACKRHVGGRKCDECAPGFYQMEGHNELGCQPCNCDAGGSIGTGCNQHTGQCHCRPRIEGLKCDKPIKDHFFPTLWQHRYEAEEGRLPDGKPVRFAIDEAQFPNFSWRGYTVFSPIQDEIILEVDIKRASVYKLLFHYINPTEVPVDVDVKFVPARTQTSDHEQKAKVVFSPNEEPTTTVVNEAKPFVLNPGRWNLHISSPKRLFLDYVVLIPEEYFEGSSLRQHVNTPCLAHGDSEEHCLDLVYPPMPTSITVDASDPGRFKVIDSTGATSDKRFRVLTDDSSRDIQVEIEVPEDDMYHLLVEYHHLNNVSVPVKVRVEQGDVVAAEGTVLINHCPYATFCRTLVAAGGRAALLGLQKSPPNAVVTFTVRPENDFGIAGVTLVKQDLWRNDFLGQVAICVRKDGKCIGQPYPQPPNSIVTEAESGKNVNNSISADKLPLRDP
ncbi:laminin alpha [Aphelenchoides avenae]|nr:laminin alpha [Aphelenchus avenae]